MSIKVEKKDKITTIGINRPEVRNAIDSETAKALAAAFHAFERDNDALVAVLYGEGRCFSAGADLKAIASEKPNEVSDTGIGPMGPTRMRLRKPVIAAIEGFAVAGGLELALWCDLRVIEDSAVMGVFSRRFGVPLIDGGTVRLPRLIGMSRAMDLVLTGRPVSAKEAFEIGLANRLVPDGFARAAAEDLATQIAEFPQTCMLSDRYCVKEQWDLSFEQALANEYHRGQAVMESGEALQGAIRFDEGEGRHGFFPKYK